MSDALFLEDVRFHARHGCGAAEPDACFAVDVQLDLDLAPAALADTLDAAVDYERVAACIVDLGTGPRVNLLERLATRIADGLLKAFPAREVQLRLRRLPGADCKVSAAHTAAGSREPGALVGAADGPRATPGVRITRRRR